MSKSIITASIAAFIGVISLVSTAHADPSTPSVVTITPSVAHTQSVLKKIYVSPEELAGIVGRYNTNNGGTMTISKSQNRIYIETEGLPKTELTPVQQNEFIAKYSDVKMKVQPNETGFASNVLVQYTAAKN
jgi:hypothetical protein